MTSYKHLPVTFHAQTDWIEAVFHAGNNERIGIRLESPKQMLDFFKGMLEKAIIVWPDDPFIQFYLNGE